MKAFVAITEPRWFETLRARPQLDEVNFWQPGGARLLRALEPGEPLLFRVRGDESKIFGGGFFTHSTRVPLWLAWRAFGRANGADSLAEIERVIRSPEGPHAEIACAVLYSPFFLDEDDAIELPEDFSSSVSYGKTYELSTEPGRSLWLRLCERLRPSAPIERLEPQASMFGEPMLVHRRLGRGGFELLVTDLYERRCAITGAQPLEALEPTHIVPVAEGGAHRVDNGLLLRADLRRLFDLGRISVSADGTVLVSEQLAETDYAQLAGSEVTLPEDRMYRPRERFLARQRRRLSRE